jgi:peptidyl-Asp metalloendopeptidase
MVEGYDMKRLLAAVCLLLIAGCQDRDPVRQNANGQASLHTAEALPGKAMSETVAGSGGLHRMAVPMPMTFAPAVSRSVPINAGFAARDHAAFDNRTKADINGDGRSDVLWYNGSFPAMAYWTMNGASVTGSAGFWTAAGFRIVGSGDFDGDGRHDIVWDNPATQALYVWLSRANGGFEYAYLASYGRPPVGNGAWTPYLICDFNGDRKPDIAWKAPVGNEFTHQAVWLLDGLTVTATAFGTWFEPAACADIIGLGREQIVNAHYNSSSVGVSFLWYRPDNAFVEYFESRIARQPASPASRLAGSADINADGIPDLIWHDAVSGIVEIWTMGRTGSGTDLRAVVQNSNIIPTDNAYRIAAIGDYDGDGVQDDVLWDRAASSTLFLWLGRGDATFASVYVTDYAPGWSVLP